MSVSMSEEDKARGETAAKADEGEKDFNGAARASGGMAGDAAKAAADGADMEPELSLEEKTLAELREKLLLKELETQSLRDQLARVQAETENFKKRIVREKNEQLLFGNEKLIKELTGIYENLQRALAAPETNAQSLKEGVQMIFKQFSAVFDKEKVAPIVALGKKFDPAMHEALSQMESAEHEENTVIQVLAPGFMLRERVLKPAKVVISRKPSKTAGSSGGGEASAAADGEKTGAAESH